MSGVTAEEASKKLKVKTSGRLGGLIGVALFFLMVIWIIALSLTPSPEFAMCNNTDATAFKYLITGGC